MCSFCHLAAQVVLLGGRHLACSLEHCCAVFFPSKSCGTPQQGVFFATQAFFGSFYSQNNWVVFLQSGYQKKSVDQLGDLLKSLRDLDVELCQLTAFYALSPTVVAEMAALSKHTALLTRCDGDERYSMAHPDLLALRSARSLNQKHLEFGWFL
jgi:hypothetical protein